jgi:signal peptidase I
MPILAAIDAFRIARTAIPDTARYHRWYLVLGLVISLQMALAWVMPRVQRVKSFYIPAASMEPTLRVGDRLIAAVGQLPIAHPRRGELVILESPESPGALMVKRIVALPGDMLEIRDKTLFVNGKPASEPWVVHTDPLTGGPGGIASPLRTRDQLEPMVVPPRHLFVMGDNRDFSYDSRFFGPVPLASVVGHPLYVYWASDRKRIGNRLDRL